MEEGADMAVEAMENLIATEVGSINHVLKKFNILRRTVFRFIFLAVATYPPSTHNLFT